MWLSSASVRNVGVKGLALSADRPDHIILFRITAGKVRAVLEGVGLDTPQQTYASVLIPAMGRK